MKHALTLGWLATALLFAQAPPSTAPQPQQAKPQAPAPAPVPRNVLTVPPETVIAIIDGQKVLASDLQAVMRAVSAAQQQQILQDPRTFVETYGLLRRLSAMAEKGGLDQKSPLKEQLAYNRTLALAQAQMAFAQEQIVVKPEEVKKFYDDNKDVFSQVRIKVIYIPFSSGAAPQAPSDPKTLTEAEAKAKTEKLYADIQAGADFVKLVKENSGDPTSAAKDGDFGVISKSDNLPEEIKTAVWALKQGQVSKPVRLPNGYYLLRAEEFTVQPFEKVQSQISDNLLNMRMNDWMKATRDSIEVKILSPDILPAAPPSNRS
jgi:hypothetical protein